MNYSMPTLKDEKDSITKLKIALVSAGLSHMPEREKPHSKLVRSGVKGATDELIKLGVKESNLINVEVPGVLEIPQMAKKLIDTHDLDGVIGFALVVSGGIYRHEFVAQVSLDCLLQVGLETGVPFASCVLTPVQPKSPETQFDMLFDHYNDKGLESARAVLEQILQLKKITSK